MLEKDKYDRLASIAALAQELELTSKENLNRIISIEKTGIPFMETNVDTVSKHFVLLINANTLSAHVIYEIYRVLGKIDPIKLEAYFKDKNERLEDVFPVGTDVLNPAIKRLLMLAILDKNRIDFFENCSDLKINSVLENDFNDCLLEMIYLKVPDEMFFDDSELMLNLGENFDMSKLSRRQENVLESYHQREFVEKYLSSDLEEISKKMK